MIDAPDWPNRLDGIKCTLLFLLYTTLRRRSDTQALIFVFLKGWQFVIVFHMVMKITSRLCPRVIQGCIMHVKAEGTKILCLSSETWRIVKHDYQRDRMSHDGL